jgi:hypothetical protein
LLLFSFPWQKQGGMFWLPENIMQGPADEMSEGHRPEFEKAGPFGYCPK